MFKEAAPQFEKNREWLKKRKRVSEMWPQAEIKQT